MTEGRGSHRTNPVGRRIGNTREPCKTHGQDGWLRAFARREEKRKSASEYEDEEQSDLRKLFQSFGGSATYLAPAPTSGKWMLFVGCPRVTACWDLVREATEAGRLGAAAKVAREDAAKLHGRTPDGMEHLICVYTRDWRDVDDVLRVATTLHELAVTGLNAAPAIYYKPNVFTYLNHKGAIYRAESPCDRLHAHSGLQDWARGRLVRPLFGWQETVEEAAGVRAVLIRD